MSVFGDLHKRVLARFGNDATLKRAGASPESVSVRAWVYDVAKNDLVGDLVQGDRKVVCGHDEMLTAGWAYPPRKGDKFISALKTYTVQSCDMISIDGLPVRYNLVVRG